MVSILILSFGVLNDIVNWIHVHSAGENMEGEIKQHYEQLQEKDKPMW